ncbi:MAG: multiheme c-type cytochrome [Proteobacteria bacterium]|nr:multiheme c-type cytochrome [Pseudomonadota bacterium]
MILRLFRLAPVVMTVACGWSGPVSAQSAPAATDSPAAVFAESSYPSATQCGACHDQIYREWASSSHAYASISPMFHKFEQRINDLTQGTIGSFCVRCHQQVGTQRGEPREAPLWQRSRVAREGVTCITCHRVEHQFGRVDGERQIVTGNIHSPVYGTLTGSMFDDVVARKGELKLALDGSERGIKIHAGVLENDQLSKPEFCQSCHQVQINLKIKLEVV